MIIMRTSMSWVHALFGLQLVLSTAVYVCGQNTDQGADREANPRCAVFDGNHKGAKLHGVEATRHLLWDPGPLNEPPRATLPLHKKRMPHQPNRWAMAIAGFSNTGTNALMQLYDKTCPRLMDAGDAAGRLSWSQPAEKHTMAALGPRGFMRVDNIEGLSTRLEVNAAKDVQDHLVNSSHPLYQRANRIHQSNFKRVNAMAFTFKDAGTKRPKEDDDFRTYVPLVIVRHPVIWLYKSTCRRSYKVRLLKGASANATLSQVSGSSPGIDAHTVACESITPGAPLVYHERNRIHDVTSFHDRKNPLAFSNTSGNAEARFEFDKPQPFDLECMVDNDGEVKRANKRMKYRSECEMDVVYGDPLDEWSDWYGSYYDMYMRGEPVVFVRQEDLLLNDFEAATAICLVTTNKTLHPHLFKSDETNSKKDSNGHHPLKGTNGKPASKNDYKTWVCNESYVWSDQNKEPFDQSAIDHIKRHLNTTLMEFFGYSTGP
eukprot:m.131813 g.131813  ORF g.131813 m.131813 type:complete len:488 (+) comp29567_c0_seq1:285-1748(+)